MLLEPDDARELVDVEARTPDEGAVDVRLAQERRDVRRLHRSAVEDPRGLGGRVAERVCAALRALIAELLGDEAAESTRILYGGSVKATNIASFLREPNVDGALVGGASLDIDEFSSIVRFKKHVGA